MKPWPVILMEHKSINTRFLDSSVAWANWQTNEKAVEKPSKLITIITIITTITIITVILIMIIIIIMIIIVIITMIIIMIIMMIIMHQKNYYY